MPNIKYICYNGEYIKTENPVLEANNRAFLYGDGLFETIHNNGTRPQFIEKHIIRLLEGMRILKMEIPNYFSADYFSKHIKGVLTRNKLFQGARARVSVFRNSGGFYSPISNRVSFLITSSILEEDKYVLNKRGYSIDIFPDLKKPINDLSKVKSSSAILFVMAGIYRSENNLDDCIILNNKERVCETISSNIFILKGATIYTPALDEGCLPGTMRQEIINILLSEDLKVNSESSITIQDLLTSDEIFITNAITGIRWILAFRKKRFYNKFSKFLINKLNEVAFGN